MQPESGREQTLKVSSIDPIVVISNLCYDVVTDPDKAQLQWSDG